MEEKLKSIHAIVHEMVKFAEAKNAVLVALSGSAVMGMLKIINDTTLSSKWMEYYCWGFVGLSTAGIVISLLLFFPVLKIKWLVNIGTPSEEDNLLLFTDISKYNTHEYLKALAQATNEPDREHNEYEFFYANQIISISNIATRKYKIFRIALGFTLSAILTPIIAIPLIVRWYCE